MTEKIEEKYPIGKIEYDRFKKSFSDKIVLRDGKYLCLRVYRIKGYDVLMRRWDLIKTTEEILPLSEYPTKPKKTIETDIILLRQATDYQSLKALRAFFKQKIKVSVKDLDSNIFLVYNSGHIYMTDLLRVTAPFQINSCPKNVKFELIGEATRITEQEKDALTKEGIPLYEELECEGKVEYMLLV